MPYVLATTESLVRWYCFSATPLAGEGEFTLSTELDLKRVPVFGDKDSARDAAQSLGLKTYRYVKL